MTSIISSRRFLLIVSLLALGNPALQVLQAEDPMPLPNPDLADLSKYHSGKGIPPAPPVDIASKLSAFDQTYTGPSRGPVDSMPLGNGDVGLNVWNEANGDLLFYIGKTDAWGESVANSKGLMKLGRIRIKFGSDKGGAPGGIATNIVQSLKLYQGEIEFSETTADGHKITARLWVDANHPVINLETHSDSPIAETVTLETWRTAQDGKFSPDVILPAPAAKNEVCWYHRDGDKADDAVKGWNFGALIRGSGFTNQSDMSLGADPSATQSFSIYVAAAKTASADEYVKLIHDGADHVYGPYGAHQINVLPKTLEDADFTIKRHDSDDPHVKADDPTPRHFGGVTSTSSHLKLESSENDTAWENHEKWWADFWARSFIFLSGDEASKATATDQGYVLQRFVTACAGRGGAPIKFNGDIFVIDWPPSMQGKPPVLTTVTADWRAWGGQYWFQNTRAMYWPRLMAGDFDIMRPLFKMYQGQLAGNTAQVKAYYNHDGAYFAETAPFWGGLPNLTHSKGSYTQNYHTPILEQTMMMLDYYDYVGDADFARNTLVPIATAGLTFFDQHFPHVNGKLVLDPDNSIEMYWQVHNPTPDIAALHAVIPRLLALPDAILPAAQKADFKRILAELPDVPTQVIDGKTMVLPYEGEQTQKAHNSENPELYAIYPFRLYGIGRGKDNFDTAVNTFLSRKIKATGCWVQDPIQAAMMGMTSLAQKDVTFDLTRKDPAERFPAFWERGHDYMPDEDNGGNGENGLQQMLLQTVDDKILLLPAWPANWNAEFRLHAPGQTVVQGKVVAGKLVGLTVTPAERAADVLIAP